MATKSIDVELLAKMFLAGAQNIEAKKEYINELNVFPVPDGDTGTNMSMTIMAAAKEVTALEGMDMASLAKAISSGSLRGASVTPVLFYPSCSADSQNPSRRKAKLMYLHLQEQLYVQKRQHIRLL